MTTTAPRSFPHNPLHRLSGILAELARELESDATSEARALLSQAKQLVDGYDDYVAKMSSPAHAIVEEMYEAGNQHDWDAIHRDGKTRYKLSAEMSAGGYEGVFLQQLAKITKAQEVLEIGMFTGTTTVALALVPTISRVVSLELEGYLETLNRPAFEKAKVSDKIDVRIGDAKVSLDKLAQEKAKFDLVFIDAHKGGYTTYLRKILDGNLLSKGGLIVADNTAFKGLPWFPNETENADGIAIVNFNKAVRNDPSLEVVMLALRDGVSLIRRKGE